MTLYPRAVVLTNTHPYGGTEMMARSLGAALLANGYDVRVHNISVGPPVVLDDPSLALTISTGALPLDLHYWRQRPDVTHIAYVIDQWPYDYVRVQGFRAFFEESKTTPNLKLACLEKNNADLIGACYMPSGPYPAPRLKVPKRHPDRLMMWGSVGGELAVTPLHDDLAATIRDNNPWGLNEARIQRAAEALRNTNISWGLGAIAGAINSTVDALLGHHAMAATCAIDSCLKRWRRVKVAMALKDYPLDIYGKGWERYGLKCQSPVPDHNHAFGHIVQHYAGLVNVDPNFGWGTNERAMTALAMGVPVAGNDNCPVNGLPGYFPYRFEDEEIQTAALLALNDSSVQAPWGWEQVVSQLLREVAA